MPAALWLTAAPRLAARPQKLSLFSCACALGAAPIILGLDAGGMSLTAKTSIAATLASFGLFTTGLVRVCGRGLVVAASGPSTCQP